MHPSVREHSTDHCQISVAAQQVSLLGGKKRLISGPLHHAKAYTFGRPTPTKTMIDHRQTDLGQAHPQNRFFDETVPNCNTFSNAPDHLDAMRSTELRIYEECQKGGRTRFSTFLKTYAGTFSKR